MKKASRIVHAGRHPEQQHGAINPPVYHVSTVVFPSVKAMEESGKAPFEGLRYGRFGTPTQFAFEEAVAELEGGWRSIATSSGLAAITGALTAFLKTGDHALITDTAYFPTRKFAETVLRGFGVEVEFYDPLIGGDIARLIKPNTKVVFVESPGSLTFEIQDIPAIADAAHQVGAVVILDNTWGTPLHFAPFTKGVDVSLQACTKYIVGHADAMLGSITTSEKYWLKIKSNVAAYGYSAGAEECYLGLRGLRTLGVRLRQHEESGLRVSRWLQDRPEVLNVLNPALPEDPGYELWKRDFTGSCGLFGVMLKPGPKAALDALLDGFEHFSLGYSWGGFESLAIPATGHSVIRTASRWEPEGNLIRLHCGLEDSDDLIADLEAGLARYSAGL